MENKKKSLPTLSAAIKARLQTLSTDVRGVWALEYSVATRISIKIGHKLLEAEAAIRSIFEKKTGYLGSIPRVLFLRN